MNSCEVTAVVTALANLIYECMSAEETAFTAAVLTQLADTLTTKLTFDELCGKS